MICEKSIFKMAAMTSFSVADKNKWVHSNRRPQKPIYAKFQDVSENNVPFVKIVKFKMATMTSKIIKRSPKVDAAMRSVRDIISPSLALIAFIV